MADAVESSVRRRFHGWIGNLVAELLTDRELLAHFISQRDEVAFAALQQRHGSMILGLCQRLLKHEQDVEDVYQATFCIFAQKAASIRNPDALGPWLYGIATRLSRKCMDKSQRRRNKERQVGRRCSPDPISELTVREAEEILHFELARLPERFRAPLILCYLEGKTRDEAAAALGYRLGTFKDRIERGKQLLQVRLTRRGVTLASVLFTGILRENVGVAAGCSLIQNTNRAVITATSGSAISAKVAALVKGGLQSMFVTRAKVIASIMFASCCIGSSAVVVSLAAADRRAKEDVNKVSQVKPLENETTDLKPGVDRLGDPLPPGALARFGTRRHRVPSYPDDWYGAPDGKSYLVAHGGSGDWEIRRLNATTGKVVETWAVAGQQKVVGFSPDRTKVLLVNENVQVLRGIRLQGLAEPKQEWIMSLFDLEQRKTIWKKQEILGASNWRHIDRAWFSPDGKTFFTKPHFSNDPTIIFWNAETGKELWTYRHERESLDPIGYTPDSKSLVCWEVNRDISVLDCALGKVVRTFPTISRDEGRQCAVTPDGKSVLIGTTGTTVRVWDIATGKERSALGEHQKGGATSLAISRDGKTLVTSGQRVAHVREWPSGKIVRTIDLGRDQGVSVMAISGDGKRLEVLFWGEKALHSYELATGKQIPIPLNVHNGVVYGIDMIPDGKLISFGKDASVRTWDFETKQAVGYFPVEQDLNSGGFATTRDGKLIAVPGSDMESVQIYERSTGKQLQRIKVRRSTILHLRFSPDGRWLAACGRDGGIHVWEWKTERTVLALKLNLAYWISCAFSPDGKALAVSDKDQVRFWQLPDWKELTPLVGKVCAELGLAYSPDGRMLAVAGIEAIRVFELATQQERFRIEPKDQVMGGLRFSPEGRFLAWIANYKMIHVWDVQRGEMLKPFDGHDDTVSGLVFTPDGKSLVTCSHDSTILAWDHVGMAKKMHSVPLRDMQQAWQTLTSVDAKIAYDAIHTLTNSPDEAVKQISERLKPAVVPDLKELETRLRDLDNPSFKVRETASAALAQFGQGANAILERFLARKPSVEARQRIERILDENRKSFAPERLRQIRTLEILEHIGNDDAKLVVDRLANGDPNAALTHDAKATAARLRR